MTETQLATTEQDGTISHVPGRTLAVLAPASAITPFAVDTYLSAAGCLTCARETRPVGWYHRRKA